MFMGVYSCTFAEAVEAFTSLSFPRTITSPTTPGLPIPNEPESQDATTSLMPREVSVVISTPEVTTTTPVPVTPSLNPFQLGELDPILGHNLSSPSTSPSKNQTLPIMVTEAGARALATGWMGAIEGFKIFLGGC